MRVNRSSGRRDDEVGDWGAVGGWEKGPEGRSRVNLKCDWRKGQRDFGTYLGKKREKNKGGGAGLEKTEMGIKKVGGVFGVASGEKGGGGWSKEKKQRF